MYFLSLSILAVASLMGLICSMSVTGSSSVCNLTKDSGTCKGHLPMYYFNSSVSQCLEFSYGGCQGNENRFQTVKECQDMCQKNINNNITTKLEEVGENVVENGEKHLVGDILSIDDEEVITEKLDFSEGFNEWRAEHFKLVDTSGVDDIPASPGQGHIVAVPDFSITDTTIKGNLEKQLHVDKNSRIEMDFFIFVDGFQENDQNKFLESNPSFQIKIRSKEKNLTIYDLENPNIKVTNGKWKKFRIPMTWYKTETIGIVVEAKMGTRLHSKVAIDDITIKRIPVAGQHLTDTKEVTKPGSKNEPSFASSSSVGPDYEVVTPAVSSNVTGSQNTAVHQGSSTSTLSSDEQQENKTYSPTTTTTLMSNLTNAEVDSEKSSSGNLGWTSDIVLICLVVVFGVSTIILVLKYVHLKKHVGDFEIGSSRQTFDNPAYDTSNARYGPTHSNS